MRKILLLVGLAAAAVLLGACGEQGAESLGGEKPATARAVVASDAYTARAGADAQRAKVAKLDQVVAGIRQETGSSGWQIRQDDVTGDAAELSGGVFLGSSGGDPLETVRTFLQRHGSAFGLTDPGAQLTFPSSLPVDSLGGATFRSRQTHGGVTVDGSDFLVAVNNANAQPEISLVRGRVFTVDIPTTPTVTEAEARTIAERIVGGPAQSPFALAVYTNTPRPTLAWSTDLLGSRQESTATVPAFQVAGAARLFLDAHSGAVIELRPIVVNRFLPQPTAGSGLANQNIELPPPGEPVQVSGMVHGDRQVTMPAERLPDGSIVLIDSSLPGADRTTKRNVISIHDGTQVGEDPDLEKLPQDVLRLPSTEVSDLDALSSYWATHEVLAYFQNEHGRDSFDGEGAPVPVTVNIPNSPGSCSTNGGFITAPSLSQMVIGEQCTDRQGEPRVAAWSDIGTIAHEYMHGVIHTHAFDIGTGSQGGAVDEGTADYFGVVIQNVVYGTTATHAELFLCQDIVSESCHPQPDGTNGLRPMDTGATLDDYLFALEEPFGPAGKLFSGRHQNAIVWTNALWSIRTRMGALDGGDVNTSPRAKRFDKIVYRAITRYFTDSTDFLAGAESIQRAADEFTDVSPQERELIRQQFTLSRFCRGCASPALTARPVAINANVKTRPHVAGPGVVYTEYTGRLSSLPYAQAVGVTEPSPAGEPGLLTLFAPASGDNAAVLAVELNRETGDERAFVALRNLATGAEEVLSDSPVPRQPAVSSSSVAWVDASGSSQGSLAWRAIDGGEVRREPVPSVVEHVAVDGSLVAFLLEDGTLGVWDAESGQVQPLASLPAVPEQLRALALAPPGGVAISANRVATIVFNGDLDRWALVVFDLEGNGAIVSDGASPFGLDLEGDLLLWAESTGVQQGRVSERLGTQVSDTDIYAYSFASDTFYSVFPLRGQQGFPDYDGSRLAWQDSALGGNDIFTVQLPSGL